MNKPPDGEMITRAWLRKRPADQNDLRSKRDPYWRLRAQGYSNSYAKRVLRGELPRLVSAQPPDLVKIAEQYGVSPDDILPLPGLSHDKLTQVEIAIRPESLTEQVVADAGPLGYEYSISDGDVPGLTLRIRSSGHKSYVLYFRVHGQKKTRKIRIATVGAVSLEMARKMARDHLYVAHRGKDPAVWQYDQIRDRIEPREDGEG